MVLRVILNIKNCSYWESQPTCLQLCESLIFPLDAGQEELKHFFSWQSKITSRKIR